MWPGKCLPREGLSTDSSIIHARWGSSTMGEHACLHHQKNQMTSIANTAERSGQDNSELSAFLHIRTSSHWLSYSNETKLTLLSFSQPTEFLASIILKRLYILDGACAARVVQLFYLYNFCCFWNFHFTRPKWTFTDLHCCYYSVIFTPCGLNTWCSTR